MDLSPIGGASVATIIWDDKNILSLIYRLFVTSGINLSQIDIDGKNGLHNIYGQLATLA